MAPTDAYRAIAGQAKPRGLAVAGHVPVFVTAEEASTSGQRSFEHLGGGWSGMLVYASREEAALRAELVSRAADPDEENGNGFARLQRAEWVNRLVDTFDPAKMDSLAALLARNGTYQTPTLALMRSAGQIPDGSFATSDRARFVPLKVRPHVGNPNGRWWKRFTSDDTAAWRRRGEMHTRIVQALHSAGVPFLTGSDSGPEGGLPPGIGIHDELQALVEAGLTPAEAPGAATLNPASYLEATDSLGTVAPGKLADLVLLSANPLEDIRDTLKIGAVVLNGRYLDRLALDALLSEAEQAASRQSRALRPAHHGVSGHPSRARRRRATSRSAGTRRRWRRCGWRTSVTWPTSAGACAR
nr:amidohydrolase [uncultured bacterium]